MRYAELMESERQPTLLLISPEAKVERFDMPFAAFLRERGLPHIGALVDAGNVWVNISWINDKAEPLVYLKTANARQVRALQTALSGFGLAPDSRIGLWHNGRSQTIRLSDLKPLRAIAAKPQKARKPSPQLAAAEAMGVMIEDDDAFGATFERVVWERVSRIEAHDPAIVSLATERNAYPGVYALHVGDPEFWFHKLINDYGNEPTAWVIEIIGAKGDVVVEDVQYTMKSDAAGYAEEGDASILLTRRRFLKEGVDFTYVRQLSDARENATDDSDAPF
jgi:hypothetical protein